MQSGDTVLIIGGLVLLTLFAMSINSSITQDKSVLYQSEQILDALVVAQKFIEQAEALRFDENKSATIPTSFVYSSKLGPDSGEKYPFFDDVDDFNGFNQSDTLSGIIPYTINISIKYVNLSQPDIPTSKRTYFKKMVVTISSPLLTEIKSRSIELKKLFSYHYFYSN